MYRIGINIRTLIPKKIGGMEHYVRQLIKGLVKSSDFCVFLFLSSHAYTTFEEIPEKQIRILLNGEDYEKQMLQSMEEYNLDLWFCPLLVLEPVFTRIPSVVTIPDIQHEFFPEYFNPEVLAWRKENYELSARTARAVLTLSEFSKNTIVKKYKVPQEKVYSVHLDVGAEFDSLDYSQELAVEYVRRFGDKYIIYPANTWPHKDHITLIKALKIVQEKIPDLHLVLTGSADTGHENVLKMIEELGLQENITILGHISTVELKSLYKGAKALIFPSKFEGFGIPLVEAMKMNCPVVSSNSTSLPEIGSEAVLYFEQGNAYELSEKISMVLIDTELSQDLVKKGAARGQQFSWKKTVEESIGIFRKVLNTSLSNGELPLVTVVTPSYNQGQFIKETIDSVLNQDYPHIEYIVMDGGSTDQTVDILKSYGDCIKWVSEKDEGQADAVNKGILIASGQIIGWLNSDDTYYPGAIREAVQFLMLHPEVGVVYGDGMHVDRNGKDLSVYPSEAYDWERLSENCFICQPSAIFRKSTAEEIGLLRKKLQLCMDYDFWIRLGKITKFAYIPKLWATSRLYSDNKTLGKRTEVYKEIIRTVKEHYSYVPFSWIYGYWHYRFDGKKSMIRDLLCLSHIILLNWLRPQKMVSEGLKLIRALNTTKEVASNKAKVVEGKWYEDGWIGTGCSWKIEDMDCKNIVIRGEHHFGNVVPMEILIKVNEDTILDQQIQNGPFELNIPIKNTGSQVIEIHANKTYIPKELNINGDTRELSVRIIELKVV